MTELARGRVGWMNWSKDGQSLLLLDRSGPGGVIAVIKVRLSDGKTEQILDLKDFVGAGYYATSLSLAPDDSLLLLKEAGSHKSKLLKANIWLSDIRTVDEMNKVWDAWVSPGNTPARATVEAKLARADLLVEIAVIAGA